MRLVVINIPNDRMAGGEETTLRNMAEHRGYTGERPLRYPIFHPILTGERLGLCAELSSISHTLGAWEPLCASYPGLSS